MWMLLFGIKIPYSYTLVCYCIAYALYYSNMYSASRNQTSVIICCINYEGRGREPDILFYNLKWPTFLGHIIRRKEIRAEFYICGQNNLNRGVERGSYVYTCV